MKSTLVKQSKFNKVDNTKTKAEKILDPSECETHLNLSASKPDTWQVYTDNPKHIAIFDSLNLQRKELGWGFEYELSINLMPLPDKQKVAIKIVDNKEVEYIPKVKQPKQRKRKQSFGEWFSNSLKFNDSREEHEVWYWVTSILGKRDVDLSLIKNLSQLRKAIVDGEINKNKEVQRFLYECYKLWKENK